MLELFVLLTAAAAFTLSASAGMGGSLILIPALSLVLGPKEGIAIASLLLGINNIAKLIAYRQWVPWRTAAGVVVLTVVGSLLGASLMIAAPESVVSGAVIAALALCFLGERVFPKKVRKAFAPVLAFGAGACSGFSGTSGPLKGTALRGLCADRWQFLGAASIVSLAGDVAKASVFAGAGLIDGIGWVLLLAAIPLTALGAWSGRLINQRIGRGAYNTLFWVVMAGYVLRLAL